MIYVVVKIVRIMQAIVFSNEKIFLTAETIFWVNQKMTSGFATMVFVSQTRISDTPKMIRNTPKMVEDSPTMF
jgi:hypothetical protein